ncbi:unnamed protein product [Sphagnum troendelagicum]|uniref:Uncharacterized protein n=1 Tax=Sphagnum troendelagicum TaxID=128251 RepID=A0ABP0UP19_9BRYO
MPDRRYSLDEQRFSSLLLFSRNVDLSHPRHCGWDDLPQSGGGGSSSSSSVGTLNSRQSEVRRTSVEGFIGSTLKRVLEFAGDSFAVKKARFSSVARPLWQS